MTVKYEWLDEYLMSMPGAKKDFKAEWGWQRYTVRGKMFAAVCAPGPEHKVYGGHELVNLKCGALLAEGFRGQYPEVLPGFYMDKQTWVAALLDGNLPDDVLMSLCDLSYRLVVEKLPKYVQRELQEKEKEE